MPQQRPFSERMGFKPTKTKIQVESVDDALRIGLWNALTVYCWDHLGDDFESRSTKGSAFFSVLWVHFFNRPLDTMRRDYIGKNLPVVREAFFALPWNEVYDFLEFAAEHFPNLRKDGFRGYCNNVLEKELSGYRFIGGKIAPITSEVELKAIENSLTLSGPLAPVRQHIQRALDLLSDRKSPDYRNSIKESISAIEAMCKISTGKDKATLDDALRILSTKIDLHAALKKAFASLYGYTSDAEGIRHALLDEPTVDFSDAMFMLLCCSAFVNYVVSKLSL
jgi:hypothetical protein